MKDFSHILYHIIMRDNITTIEDSEQTHQRLLMPHLHNIHLNKITAQTLQFCLDQKCNDPINLDAEIFENAKAERTEHIPNTQRIDPTLFARDLKTWLTRTDPKKKHICIGRYL